MNLKAKKIVLPVVLLWQKQLFLDNFVFEESNNTNEKPELFRSTVKPDDDNFLLQNMEQLIQTKIWMPQQREEYRSRKNTQRRSCCSERSQ